MDVGTLIDLAVHYPTFYKVISKNDSVYEIEGLMMISFCYARMICGWRRKPFANQVNDILS